MTESPDETTTRASATDEPAPYRVLVVEDDRSQALFAQSVLNGAGIEATLQTEAAGVLDAIRAHKPDLVLMDLHMPEIDGMRLTTLIRQQPGQQMLPIVFLTGDADPERQFEALDIGADDVLTKPIRPRHLIAAISNRIQRARAQAQASTPHQAVSSHPDTGLFIRPHLLQMIGDALKDKAHGGVFFVEIASALGLRERYGYAAFERLMTEAGRQIAKAVAPHPATRLNDNSFLVLARVDDESALAGFARELRDKLSRHVFVARDEETVQLRSAVGYTALSHGVTSAEAVLEATERAALQARLQPAGIAAYDPPRANESVEKISFVDGQIELAYQPIVSVAGGDQAQYQVLLRMRQSDGTLLTAGQVLPAAEAAGRIADLDQQVMDHALTMLGQKLASNHPLRLFVSQAPRTLSGDAYPAWVLQSLQDRGIPGESLVIDLRLADAAIHSVAIGAFCARLAPAGVRFCLSQFEAGEDGLALLGQLPLSYVRLAGRYAGAYAHKGLREDMLAIIQNVHGRGMQVIGQQIEDPQAAATMWMDGIDFIQGNLVQSVGQDLQFDFHNAVL